MAATFYWMAKVAGYDAHYVKGYFQKSGGKKGAHAWVEIDQKVNGKKKLMCMIRISRRNTN